MNSKVDRFPNIEEKTPGPGAYLNKEKAENEKIVKKNNKLYLLKIILIKIPKI